MEPNESMPFYHKHTEDEEVYIILSGICEFEIDNKKLTSDGIEL